MKKAYKVIYIVLIVFLILVTFNLEIYATDSIIQGADNFLEKGKNNSILNSDNIKNASDKIFNVFSIAGIVTVVIVGAILGIRFIMGSVTEKAEIKESLTPYIIGAIVIFGAVGIWGLAVNVMQGIF